jgi:2-octaprenyl-6-methoxyphenol hydroxylase
MASEAGQPTVGHPTMGSLDDRRALQDATPPIEVDVAVVGAGAAGLAAAIALARQGWSVALLGPGGARRDGRTVALMEGSLRFLDGLGVWPRLAGLAAPLETLTIIDDTGSLLRAPPVSFHAGELGLAAFGENIENAALVDGLTAACTETAGITHLPSPMARVMLGDEAASLVLQDGSSVTARLVVGADGRFSPVRTAACIATREWEYDQVALTAILAHGRPHREVSTEFHTRQGPFTLVPLPGRRSSLVWLTSPERAEELQTLDDGAFALAVERQAQSMLGAMTLDGPRGAVPMSGLSVDRFTGTRAVLVGEAAHVFPPIGAQGLNLGLRDVHALVDAVGAKAAGVDPGAPRVLTAYERSRGFDVRSRTGFVDALNRSLLAGFLPIDMVRGLGLMALSSIRPLRRIVMRQGLGA